MVHIITIVDWQVLFQRIEQLVSHVALIQMEVQQMTAKCLVGRKEMIVESSNCSAVK